MLVYLNDALVPRERATVPVDDRGFLFGDGVYEVLRVVDGALVEGPRHWRRLARGLAGLAIQRPAWLPDDDALDEVCARLLDENDLLHGDALIYLQITRGAAAPRTHHFPPAGTLPTVYIAASRFTRPDAVRARGATAITQPDLRWLRCDLKTVNLLPNVLARQAAVAAGADEALFVRDGLVIEGASSNLFALIGGRLRTHPATHAILPGVTREVVLEIAPALGLTIDETPIRIEELFTAAEVFISGTTNDVMPIVRVDGRAIADGKPGTVTRRLVDAVLGRQGGVKV